MPQAETIRRAREAVAAHGDRLAETHLTDLFAADPDRAARFTAEALGLVLDASKQRIDADALAGLIALAEACDLDARRRAMFDGLPVNETEGRPALHTALRDLSGEPVLVEGRDVLPEVRATLDRMGALVRAVHDGERRGFDGARFHDVVNIGIGGSNLGPRMACAALDVYRTTDIGVHHVSNLDGADIESVLRGLDPATTLFIVVSKTFGTQETLRNAQRARRWIVDAFGDDAAVARHFVAVSANLDRVEAFGIGADDTFPIWDWVGGRYSLWSAVGLSVACSIGMEGFEAMLAGAHAMDRHFLDAPLERNLPVLLGLLGVWNTDVLGAETRAVLPYDWPLRLLPAHLQQLEMESNGKRVTRSGEPVLNGTCPIVWGGPGSDGQHAFYQLLHQGTRPVPVDFLVALASLGADDEHQDEVLANAFGQAEALMCGRSEEAAREALEAAGMDPEHARRLAPHQVMPGNRPSTSILYGFLTPALLGSIVAMYEHRVFVESVIWDVNPFDQWGVELGKQLAATILGELRSTAPLDGHDGSTRALIERGRA